MNPVLLTIILVPIMEIYLFIKIGSQIGAFNTVFLIFLTAIIGVYYAKYEGLNTFKTGFSQIIKNEVPAYEIISGAAIAFAAVNAIIARLRNTTASACPNVIRLTTSTDLMFLIDSIISEPNRITVQSSHAIDCKSIKD